MGNSCQNQNVNATKVFTQEQDSILIEENLKAIQNMSPVIQQHEYLLENLNEGIRASTITEIIIKPRNQDQVLEILRGIKNQETEIRYNYQYEQGLGTPSSKNDTKRSTGVKCQSEKHVHFQIPQMQIVKHEYQYRKKYVKK
ncbi:unnamed protein product [Paramecium sonneborni]|uniref:Uncharacterized protein n=1 Tax=Paramecium sonneborni TaxID=65129 RepID=A0A8S1LCP7_9CILI|nr:unnamed protein product [Paramecium sonneborni]